MLRETTLYAMSAVATADYYTQYLTDAPGEQPGIWTGAQAERLGLSGTVSTDALRTLLEGRDPMSGSPLGMTLTDRTLANGKTIRAVAGFDATFSAPKSVSVLWSLTGNPAIVDVQAVRVALANLERFGASTRVRVNGTRQHPDTNGLTRATFLQTTSRADDPQLHTHAVISAKVQTPDGRWWALDARYLKRHQRMLGGFYQSALRAGMIERFGVSFTPVVNGQAEMVGMPDVLLDVFSKRTHQVDHSLTTKIEEFRGRQGRDPTRWERAALTREAAADTRGRKTGLGVDDLDARWQSEAARLGWDADRVLESIRSTDRTVVGSVTVDEVIDRLSTLGSS